MSDDSYLIAISDAEAEIEVKGSRFIACISPAKILKKLATSKSQLRSATQKRATIALLRYLVTLMTVTVMLIVMTVSPLERLAGLC